MDFEEYRDRKRNLRDKHEQELKRLHKAYAFSNSTVIIGDMVTDHMGPVKVDKVTWALSLGNAPQCVYHGQCYTKAGKPFKSEEH